MHFALSKPTLWSALLALLLLPATLLASTPEGVSVSFETSDGVQLQGTYYAASGTPLAAVVWVHELGHSGSDWNYIATQLTDLGVASLTFDLRGHGGSLEGPEGPLDRDLFGPAEYHSMLADVHAAADFLLAHLGEQACPLHLVGAAYGSSLALYHATEDSRVEDLVLLSPGLYYEELNTSGKITAYGARRLLLVYSREDGYSMRSAVRMETEAKGPSLTRAYYGAGHGALMMGRESDLEPLLQGWLLGSINPTAPALPEGAEARLDASAKDALEDDPGALAQAEAERRETRERSAAEARSQERDSGEGASLEVDARRWDESDEDSSGEQGAGP